MRKVHHKIRKAKRKQWSAPPQGYPIWRYFGLVQRSPPLLSSCDLQRKIYLAASLFLKGTQRAWDRSKSALCLLWPSHVAVVHNLLQILWYCWILHASSKHNQLLCRLFFISINVLTGRPCVRFSPSTLLKTVGWMKYPLSPWRAPPATTLAPSSFPDWISSWIFSNWSLSTYSTI